MVKVGFDQPLLDTITFRPSGDSIIARGRSPTVKCRPAGAIRHPLGRSVVPPPSGPGHFSFDGASTCAPSVVATARATRIAEPSEERARGLIMPRTLRQP